MKRIWALRRMLLGKLLDWRARQRHRVLTQYVVSRLEPELEARGFSRRRAETWLSLQIPIVHLRRADFGTQDQVNAFEVDVDERGDKQLFFRPFVLFYSPTTTIFNILVGEGRAALNALGRLDYEDIFGPLPLRDQGDADRAVAGLVKHWLPLLDKTATLRELYVVLSRSRRARDGWLSRGGGRGLIYVAHLLQRAELPQHMADYVKGGEEPQARAEAFVRCVEAIQPLDWAPPYSPRRGRHGDEGQSGPELAAHDGRDDMMTTLAFRSLVRLMARNEAEAQEFTARLKASIAGGETVSLALLRDAAEPALCVFDWHGEPGQHLELGALVNAWGVPAVTIAHHEDMARQFDAASKVASGCGLALLAVDTQSDIFVFLCVRADHQKIAKDLLYSAGLRTV